MKVDNVDELRSLLDDPETGMLAHLQLEETADYFLLPQMSKYVRLSIHDCLSRIGKLVREAYPREVSIRKSRTQR